MQIRAANVGMMSNTTTTHTAATLAALPPRELDALAYFYVLGRGVVGMRDGEPVVVPMREYDGPQFSTDLNAAALLEAELARRGLGKRYAEWLYRLSKSDLIALDDAHSEPCPDMAVLFGLITISAKQRTIAAILAAQG